MRRLVSRFVEPLLFEENFEVLERIFLILGEIAQMAMRIADVVAANAQDSFCRRVAHVYRFSLRRPGNKRDCGAKRICAVQLRQLRGLRWALDCARWRRRTCGLCCLCLSQRVMLSFEMEGGRGSMGIVKPRKSEDPETAPPPQKRHHFCGQHAIGRRPEEPHLR